MNERKVCLLVTDLDGSLLNHYDYSFAAALPAMKRLESLHIPVILNTSKTYLETIEIQQQLSLHAPFIVENGSCLYLPKHQFDVVPSQFAFSRDDFWGIKLGRGFKEITRLLDKTLNDNDQLIKLTDCSQQQVVDLTGLSPAQAHAAVQREYSQPVLWQGDSAGLAAFKQRLQRQSLNTLQGGRFLHIQGATDKGLAIEKMKSFYTSNVRTVVIGDSANDLAMLRHADIPVVIKSPGNDYLLQQQSFPFISESEAPAGWCEGVEYALQQISEVKV